MREYQASGFRWADGIWAKTAPAVNVSDTMIEDGIFTFLKFYD